MLSEDVGGRAHLVVVNQVIVRHQVRMPVLNHVARVAAEEKRFRLAAARAARCESESRQYIFP